jgi:pimeloyl-ACP methyl ester carboxylesterase
VIANGDPTARPLVLLHATGTSPTGWLLNVGPLSTRHRVFAVDIMGEAGMSQQTRVLRNRQDCVDWLASVLDGLGLDRVRLAGWSFGGWLTLAFVVAEPDRVDRTVLLAPFGSLAPYAPAVMLFLKLGPYLPMGPPGRLALRMMSPGYQFRERFARQFVLGGRYFRSANPLTRNSSRFGLLLLLIGNRESTFDPHHAVSHARRCLHKVEADVLPGVGNMVAMEAAEAVNDRMLRFLGG